MRKQQEENWCMMAGMISSGKSKFLNIIFPRISLPVGGIPLTAAPTFIRYGADALEVITDKEQLIKTSLEELAVYSKKWTKQENGIHKLDVYVEEPILKNNLVFIDMPGIGTMEEKADSLFLEFLPQVQVVFYFLEKGITKEDKKYLDEIYRQKSKLIVVRTKIDNVYSSEEKIEEVLLEEQNNIFNLYPECQVYFVSLEQEMEVSQLKQLKIYISCFLNQEASEVKKIKQRKFLTENLMEKRQELLNKLQQKEKKSDFRNLEKSGKKRLEEAELFLKYAEADIRKAIDSGKNRCKIQGLEYLCNRFPDGNWSEEDELNVIKTELSTLNSWYQKYMNNLIKNDSFIFFLPESTSRLFIEDVVDLEEKKYYYKKLVNQCFSIVKENFFQYFQKEVKKFRDEFYGNVEREKKLIAQILDIDRQITRENVKKQLVETEEKLQEMRNGLYGETAV